MKVVKNIIIFIILIAIIVGSIITYKGYEIYGKAANDSDIAYVIEKIKPVVSRVIAHVYAISEEKQLAFTQRAIDKFQNEEIIDTIYRNARSNNEKGQFFDDDGTQPVLKTRNLLDCYSLWETGVVLGSKVVNMLSTLKMSLDIILSTDVSASP